MKENRKLIQIILIFTGLFLIIATYFYYPKINENKLRGSVIQDKPTDITDEANKDNTFENVEYKGLYDFDKPFIIISEKAYILSENPNIIYMADMKVTINMSDGRTVIITGDKGTYNKKTHDCFFENNVKATDGETIIQSENLDLFASKDIASIYNNVNLINENGSLKADKVDYDFETKYYKISMFNDKKVKINLIQ
tara:strand:+ start:405 stop:995 length:591 start_codon:yes stop_codon:yes gene_type:complete